MRVCERMGRIVLHCICEHMVRSVVWVCSCVPSKDVYRDLRRPCLDQHATTVFHAFQNRLFIRPASPCLCPRRRAIPVLVLRCPRFLSLSAVVHGLRPCQSPCQSSHRFPGSRPLSSFGSPRHVCTLSPVHLVTITLIVLIRLPLLSDGLLIAPDSVIRVQFRVSWGCFIRIRQYMRCRHRFPRYHRYSRGPCMFLRKVITGVDRITAFSSSIAL